MSEFLYYVLPIYYLFKITLIALSLGVIKTYTERHVERLGGTVLLPPLIGTMAGTTTTFWLPTSWSAIILFCSLPLYFAAYRIEQNNSILSWPLIACMYFLGAGLCALHCSYFNFVNATIQGKIITIHATVTDIERLPDNYRLTVHIDVLHDEQSDKTYQTSFYAFASTKRLTCAVADQISINHYRIPKRSDDKNISSFDRYLIRNNCALSLFLCAKHQLTVAARPEQSFKRWLWQKRSALYQRIMTGLTTNTKQFFGPLFFGNKIAVVSEFKQSFNQWGITHYLARSGLHIALLIIIWSFLLSFIPLHITYKRILLVGVATIYHFLSWPSISFVRALLLFYLISFGKISQQITRGIHLLYIVAFLAIFYSPVIILFLDVQLTFILTATLMHLST